MTVESLGVKLYSGLKSDRVSDSLGSSADGVNTNVTIPTSLQEFTTDENTNLLHTSRRYGVRLKSGNPAIGGTCTGIAFKLLDDNFPSGNFYYKIYRSSDGGSTYSATAERTITIPDTDLPQSEAYLEKTLSSSIVLQEHDIITLQVDNLGQAGQEIEIGLATTDATIASANLEQAMWNIGNTNNAWTFETSECPCIKIIGNPAKLGTGCYDYDGSSTTKTLLGETSMWDFIHTASAWSMAFWINIPSVVEKQVFNQNVNPPTHAFDYILLSSTNARLRVRGTSISYAHGFSANTWHHVAFTYDGTNIRIYTDGVLKDKTAYTAGGNTGSNPITIAHSYVDSNHGDYLMDDMGFWGRLLTTAEINELVNANTGGITWSTEGKVGWDIYGSTIKRTGSDGWSTSKIQSTNTWTVGSGAFEIEFSGGSSTTTSCMFGFNKGTLGYYYGSGTPLNKADFSIYMAGGEKIEVYESGTKVYSETSTTRDGSEVYKITVANDGTVKYYRDGVEKYESLNTASGTYFVQANAYDADSTAKFSGAYDGALVSSLSNKQELKAYYSFDSLLTSNLTNLTGLEAYYNFNESSGNLLNKATTLGSSDSNGVDLQNTNLTQDATGKFGKCYNNGTSGVSHEGALGSSGANTNWEFLYGSGDRQWTWTGWVKRASATQNDDANFFDNTSSASGTGIQCAVRGDSRSDDGALKVTLIGDGDYSDAMWKAQTADDFLPSDTDWHFIAITCDLNSASNQVNFIMDNGTPSTQSFVAQSGSSAYSAGNSGHDGNPYYTFGCNAFARTSTSRESFQGFVDDYSFWSRILGNSEITALFENPLGSPCKNNASSTSSLEALDGVRDNSIFTQTDDVPAYYWYQTLDGVTAWFPQLQYNFSDTTRWTATGDKTVNVTGNAIEASDFEGNDESERVYGEVGDLETKFVADFDYYQGTAESGAYWSLCSFQSGTDYPYQSGMNSVGLIVDMGNYAIYTRSYDGSSENSTQTGDSISLSVNTQYYVRIIRDGDDFTFSFYTSRDRTSATKVGTRTLTDTGITGLKYFQSGYFTGGNDGAINYKITNLKIYNGVTSV